jgi:hypothetical protein
LSFYYLLSVSFHRGRACPAVYPLALPLDCPRQSATVW